MTTNKRMSAEHPTAKHAHPEMKMWISALVLIVLAIIAFVIANEVYWKQYLKNKQASTANQDKNAAIAIYSIGTALLLACYFVFMHHIAARHKTAYWVGAVIWFIAVVLITIGLVFDNANNTATTATFVPS